MKLSMRLIWCMYLKWGTWSVFVELMKLIIARVFSLRYEIWILCMQMDFDDQSHDETEWLPQIWFSRKMETIWYIHITNTYIFLYCLYVCIHIYICNCNDFFHETSFCITVNVISLYLSQQIKHPFDACVYKFPLS